MVPVEKSVTSKDYKLFLRDLRHARRLAGLSQVELAKRFKETQIFVSKSERGERQIDVLELRVICKAIGISFQLSQSRSIPSSSSRTLYPRTSGLSH